MRYYLQSAIVTVFGHDDCELFSITIMPDNVGDRTITEQLVQFETFDNRSGSTLKWKTYVTENKSTLELEDDDSPRVMLLEEAGYFINLILDESLDLPIFLDLEGKNNQYASISKIPGSKMWLLKTKSSAGIIPFSVGDIVVLIDVRPSKIGYLEDYRQMIRDLVEKEIEFVLDPKSPAFLQMDLTERQQDNESPYICAVIMDALFNSRVFKEALNTLIAMPYKASREENIMVRTGASGGSVSSYQIMEAFRSGTDLQPLPPGHLLEYSLRGYIPAFVESTTFDVDADNDENRFVVYMLDNILSELSDVKEALRGKGTSQKGPVVKLLNNLQAIEELIFRVRYAEPFSRITPLADPPSGSTVLAGAPGYREIYSAWLLSKSGVSIGYDFFEGLLAGSKSLWKLYQSWCLLAIHSVLDSGPDTFGGGVSWEAESSLWCPIRTKYGGNSYALVKDKSERTGKWKDITIRLSYEKRFPYSGSKDEKFSSYSVLMIPDITIMAWKADSPHVVMIHFDAKYSVQSSYQEQDDDEENIEIEPTKTVRTSDVQKMHAYMDGIRSPKHWSRKFETDASFVLFPGNIDEVLKPGDRMDTVMMVDTIGQWHPGLGALPVCPSDSLDMLNRLIWTWIKSLENRCECPRKLTPEK